MVSCLCWSGMPWSSAEPWCPWALTRFRTMGLFTLKWNQQECAPLASLWLGEGTGNQLNVKQRWWFKNILGRAMARIAAWGCHAPFPNRVITVTITGCFLRPRHFCKHLLPLASVNPPDNSVGWVLLLFAFQSEEAELGNLIIFPKATQRVSGRART